MDNLFDFLENQTRDENKQDKETQDKKENEVIIASKARKTVDEQHLKYIEEIKITLYNDEEIKKSGLERKEYIRLNSYIGARLDTDLRGKTTLKEIVVETEVIDIAQNIEFTKELNINQFETIDMEEDIFGDELVEEKLLIVDGSSLLSTSFYATARDLLFAKTDEQKEFAYTKLMKSPDGEYTNGVYMFFKTLLPLLEKQKISHLAVVLDRSRNTFRREIDPEYKANRSETPYPLKSQFMMLTELLKEINIPVFSHGDYEADDFAGTITKKFEKDISIYLHTKDEDYLQLVSEYTKLWMVTGKAEDMYKELGINKNDLKIPNGVFEYTPKYVKYFKGVDPIQIIDIKAIEGDKSDNIKGVKNVGPTSSRPLVAHYGSVEGIYEVLDNLDKDKEKELNTFFKESLGIKRTPIKNLLLYKEDAIISKKLATIKTDIEEIQELELDKLKLDINIDKMELEFKRLGMNSLMK
ncbi:MAG: 5'-3' exonuclease [Romboutsia sp.]|uniref:5'-3' exonuclease n=1 Tax=Romboutsia sp. TaxID=1965302 RepID=UPI003F37DBF4